MTHNSTRVNFLLIDYNFIHFCIYIFVCFTFCVTNSSRDITGIFGVFPSYLSKEIYPTWTQIIPKKIETISRHVPDRSSLSRLTGHYFRKDAILPRMILFSDPARSMLEREPLVCTGTVADRPMRRILGFPLRRRVIRSSSTMPRASSRFVGDVGQPHSRAIVAVRWSFRDVVVTSAPSLISFSRFLFAQPAKMVWITVDDQVYRLVGPIATDLSPQECDLQWFSSLRSM